MSSRKRRGEKADAGGIVGFRCCMEEPAASESPDRQAFEEGGDDQESADELIEEVEEVSAEEGSEQDSTTSTRHDRAAPDVTDDE